MSVRNWADGLAYSDREQVADIRSALSGDYDMECKEVGKFWKSSCIAKQIEPDGACRKKNCSCGEAFLDEKQMKVKQWHKDADKRKQARRELERKADAAARKAEQRKKNSAKTRLVKMAAEKLGGVDVMCAAFGITRDQFKNYTMRDRSVPKRILDRCEAIMGGR